MPLLAAIVPWVVANFGAFFTAAAARVLVFKALGLTLFVSVLPVVGKNLFVWAINFMNSYISEELAGREIQAQIIELTGLAAYFGNCFMLPECVAVLLTGVAIRLVIMVIPFIG